VGIYIYIYIHIYIHIHAFVFADCMRARPLGKAGDVNAAKCHHAAEHEVRNCISDSKKMAGELKAWQQGVS
jgi:hypothetical protein